MVEAACPAPELRAGGHPLWASVPGQFVAMGLVGTAVALMAVGVLGLVGLVGLILLHGRRR
jgi:hypothetical protein